MSAFGLIIFGLVGWWVYYCVKREGVYWIPRFFLCLAAFVGFFWGITFIYPYIYEPFLKSNSALGELTKTVIFSSTYAIIYLFCIDATILKWVEILEKKIEERFGKNIYNKKKDE